MCGLSVRWGPVILGRSAGGGVTVWPRAPFLSSGLFRRGHGPATLSIHLLTPIQGIWEANQCVGISVGGPQPAPGQSVLHLGRRDARPGCRSARRRSLTAEPRPALGPSMAVASVHTALFSSVLRGSAEAGGAETGRPPDLGRPPVRIAGTQ